MHGISAWVVHGVGHGMVMEHGYDTAARSIFFNLLSSSRKLLLVENLQQNTLKKGEIAQMVVQVLVNNFQAVPGLNPG